jgi:hypothetical protein
VNVVAATFEGDDLRVHASFWIDDPNQTNPCCIEAHVKSVTERLESRAEEAGGQSPNERLHLAAIRGIADELDRSLAQTSSEPRLSLRRQLADELERLARELRQNDSTVDGEEWLRR